MGNPYNDTVDAYNTSLTRSTRTALSVARGSLAGASVGNHALFGGGTGSGATKRDTVDAYNISLTRSTPTALSVARNYLAGASVGNYALFGGGDDTVDAYTTERSAANFYVPIGTKYMFESAEQIASTTEITAFTPVTGYIKYKRGVIN